MPPIMPPMSCLLIEPDWGEGDGGSGGEGGVDSSTSSATLTSVGEVASELEVKAVGSGSITSSSLPTMAKVVK